MIRLEHLSKTFRIDGTRKVVADNISATFASKRSVALLGRNGAGKSTLLRMIAGTVLPCSGRVLSRGSISYPVGFSGSFHPQLTGAQNARFVARIYGVDTDDLAAFVEDFAELGPHFHLPFHTYSAGMKARLSFGVSMGIPFDTYLVDEVTSVGDKVFREKSTRVFNARRQQAGALVVSHSMPVLREICESGAVLSGGRLTCHDTLDDAIRHHEDLLRHPVNA